MEIPGLGLLTPDDYEYASAPVPVPVFGGLPCRFLVDGDEYPDDPAQEEFHQAIASFLDLDESALTAAAPAIFEYYQDTAAVSDEESWDYASIAGPQDVWEHVTIGRDVLVSRDSGGDERVYVSVECECSWEAEHGLQLVFREGRSVTRVGPYDGHLTNAGAVPGRDLGAVVYVGARMMRGRGPAGAAG